jgi:hypothetical protein
MADLFLLGIGLIGGYVAAIYTWPTIKIWANGVTAEANKLRMRAQELEDKLRTR